MSALHDCVISDLRFKKTRQDRVPRVEEERRPAASRRSAARRCKAAMAEVLAKQRRCPSPKDFVDTYERRRRKLLERPAAVRELPAASTTTTCGGC